MKNKTLKEGLALLGIGAAVVALALHPPRLLCRIWPLKRPRRCFWASCWRWRALPRCWA